MPVMTAREPRRTSAWKRVSRYASLNAAQLAAGIQGPKYNHPKTFSEFYDREPELVTNWLKGKRCPKELLEDYTQDLLMFLMRPVTSKAGVTYEDHIAYYQPELMGNYRTRPAFLKHLFGMLSTEYPKAIKRHQRGMTSGVNFVSLPCNGDSAVLGNNYTYSTVPRPVVAPHALEVVLQPVLTPDDIHTLQVEDEPSDPQLVVDSFFAYLEDVAEPDVVVYARASLVYDTALDISRAMGFSRSQCRTLTQDVTYWAKRFRAR